MDSLEIEPGVLDDIFAGEYGAMDVEQAFPRNDMFSGPGERGGGHFAPEFPNALFSTGSDSGSSISPQSSDASSPEMFTVGGLGGVWVKQEDFGGEANGASEVGRVSPFSSASSASSSSPLTLSPSSGGEQGSGAPLFGASAESMQQSGYVESSEGSSRKRRRVKSDPHDEAESIAWRELHDPHCTQLFDGQGNQVPLLFTVGLSKPFEYAKDDHVHIHYRRNQFSVNYSAARSTVANRPGESLMVKSDSGWQNVTRLEVTVEAIETDVADPMFNPNIYGERVSLSQKSIPSKSVEPPSPLPIALGERVSHERMYFDRSTTNNGQPIRWEENAAANGDGGQKYQHFFRLLNCLWGIDGAGGRHLLKVMIGPPTMVRGRNPGGYGDGKKGASDSKADSGSGWKSNGKAMTTDGPVGINDPKPAEALSVRGNIQVTGTLLKPSDRRIKSDIVPVDTKKSLQTVRDLQVYDYKREDLGTGELVSERGVMAQELEEVLPDAVHTQGDVVLPSSGEVVTDLKVVDDRSLLYEALGATQQIDEDVGLLTEEVAQIETRVQIMEEWVPGRNMESSRRYCMTLMCLVLALVTVVGVAVLVVALHGPPPPPPTGTSRSAVEPATIETLPSLAEGQILFVLTGSNGIYTAYDANSCVSHQEVIDPSDPFSFSTVTISTSSTSNVDLSAFSFSSVSDTMELSAVFESAASFLSLAQMEIPGISVAPSAVYDNAWFPSADTGGSNDKRDAAVSPQSPSVAPSVEASSILDGAWQGVSIQSILGGGHTDPVTEQDGDDDDNGDSAKYCNKLFVRGESDYVTTRFQCVPPAVGSASSSKCQYVWDMEQCVRPDNEPHAEKADYCERLYPVEHTVVHNSNSPYIGRIPDSRGVFQFVIDLSACVAPTISDIDDPNSPFVYCRVLPLFEE